MLCDVGLLDQTAWVRLTPLNVRIKICDVLTNTAPLDRDGLKMTVESPLSLVQML